MDRGDARMNMVDTIPMVLVVGIFVLLIGNLVLRYYMAYKEIIGAMRK